MICGKTVDPRCAEGICDECARQMAEHRVVVPSGENRYVVSVYYFQEPLRRGLHQFKYGGKRAFGIHLGRKLAERYRQRGDRADVVTCVPRAKDGKPRMYNQSAVIAKVVAKELNLPFDPKLLRKRNGMRSQPECHTHLAREENAKRAYRNGSSRRDVTGQRVMLVDDLYTTGATVNACCNLLKQRGAADTLAYTALRAHPENLPPLVANFDRLYVHQDFTDPTFYPTRRFRRKHTSNKYF